MKRNNIIKGVALTVVATFLTIQACNDLDLQPLDRVTTETYYKTPGDFDGAIFASYSSIQDFWGTSTENLGERGEFWEISMLATDDVDFDPNSCECGGGSNRDMDNLLFRSSDVPFEALYTQIYEGILRANLVIEAAGGQNSLTADQKKQYVAEAKFLRAFNHFLALQMWGTPPLVLEVKKDINNLAEANATQEALYTAILADLKEASAGLPASWNASNLGRATKWSSRALEGKVNVWKKDWAAAIAAFEDVEKNGPYKLFSNYEDAFAYDMENKDESIFEVQYGGPFSDDNLWVFDDTHSEAFKASQGTGRIWYWQPRGGVGAPASNQLGNWVPSKNLVDEYEKGDTRFANNIYQEGDTYYVSLGGSQKTAPFKATWTSSGYAIKKYFGKRNAVGANTAPNDNADFNNERYFRYAELLLLHAEALISSGKAAEGLSIINNQIRKRAGLGATTITDPVKALRHEKRVEMAFEPHRWFDITRWGIGAEIFGAKWKAHYNVFPFPQAEISRSNGKLKQNTGY